MSVLELEKIPPTAVIARKTVRVSRELLAIKAT